MSDSETPRPEGVSVVIPTLNAAAYLDALYSALFDQADAAVSEVILVDSMSADGTPTAAARRPQTSVLHIANFSHGRARNMGAAAAKGEVVVFLSQDALPADRRWLAELLAPLADPSVAAVYSRQIPREDANPMERYFLQTHFPVGEPVRRERAGRTEFNLQDVFFSNVSAAVRREVLLKYPFDEDLIMSEDQLFAKDIIRAGLATVYQPSSVVRHSHKYSLATALKRYFDSVYSLSLIFPAHDLGTSAAIGWRYVGGEVRYIARQYPRWLGYYLLYTMAKTAGTILAHFADCLPRRLLKKISLHSYYWNESPCLREGRVHESCSRHP